MSVDKSKLLARRLPEGTVEIDGLGEVTVRGFSRAEAYAFIALDSREEQEVMALYLGLVDPVLTEEEATTWRCSATFDEISRVVATILRLSGLATDEEPPPFPGATSPEETEPSSSASAGPSEE
jgi:hypothetical protein